MRRALLLVIFALIAAPVSATTISFNQSSTTVTLGDPAFNVNVEIAEVDDLYAHDFSFSFDPAVVSVNSVSEGPFLSSGGSTVWPLVYPLTFFTIDNAAGNVTFIVNSIVDFVPGVTGSGTLAIINFSPVGVGTSQLSFFDVALENSIGPIDLDDFELQNGQVEVLENTTVQPVPEPTSMVLIGTGVAGLVYRRRRKS